MITGTAAASPTVPATPAGTVALAQVYTAGGAATPTSVNDVRPGNLSVASSADRPSSPRGYVAGVTGPASAFDAASGTIITSPCPSSPAAATGSAASSRHPTNLDRLHLRVFERQRRLLQPATCGASGRKAGSWPPHGSGGSSKTFLATATGTVTITVSANVGTGTLSVGVNWAWITVEDIGT